MKKAIALMSAALVICGIVLTGCGQKKQQDQAGQQNGTQQQSKMEQKGEAEQAVPSGSADKNEKIISGLKRISKPGLRVYANTEDIPKVLGGLGTAIISTNKGVVTDKEARKLGVGGEVLCFVW